MVGDTRGSDTVHTRYARKGTPTAMHAGQRMPCYTPCATPRSAPAPAPCHRRPHLHGGGQPRQQHSPVLHQAGSDGRIGRALAAGDIADGTRITIDVEDGELIVRQGPVQEDEERVSDRAA